MIRSFAIDVPQAAIASFCERWKIVELSLFGSALDDRLRPDSDVDVLVRFAPEAEWDLIDAARMEEELETIFHRPVDLVTRRAIDASSNPSRKRSILESAAPIYVAQR